MVAELQRSSSSRKPLNTPMLIEGKISRIRFKADDTGYVVILLEIPGNFDEFTAVGTMPDAEKGMSVLLSGEWITNPKWGKQFKFNSYSVPQPEGEDGTIAYLSTLKCVKESLARRIYAEFGDDIFRVLDEEPDRLLQVRGIGEKNLSKIIESYEKTKGIRNLISFLHELGVSAGYAPKIYKEFQEDSIATIKQNPYILADTVRGFGFKRSDEVARGLNIAVDSKIRIEAGIIHALKTAANQQGHCYLPEDELCVAVCELLTLPDYFPKLEDVEGVIRSLKRVDVKETRRLMSDEMNNEDVIYTWSLWRCECELADYIKDLSGQFSNAIDVDGWINGYESRESIALASGQKDAVRSVAQNKFVIMTGGAGVGKSATSKAVVQLWHDQGKRIVAAAPTGRAAQRIKEATGQKASTIHRLLGWNGYGFEHNGENPIPGDAFLIDEASMMDLRLAYALFKAIPAHASVLLVGDVNQLPSVGAGNVLRDIINSEVVPVVRLTQIFRQGATSRIIACSHQINNGEFPHLEPIGRSTDRPSTDALWVKCKQEKILEAIEWLTSEKLLELGWQPDQIQVLSPQHKGEVGNIALNGMLQKIWNPSTRVKNELKGFREGDRVIQTVNNYDKGIFNGDIGKIEKIDVTEKAIDIRFPDPENVMGKVVTIDDSDLDDVMLAYSVSVHKFQGSEWPVIIMPATMQQFMLLNRAVYYTGVTRAKKLLVLVGEERAIGTAVRNQKISQRYTGLAARLGEGQSQFF